MISRKKDQIYGPQTQRVELMFERIRELTEQEVHDLTEFVRIRSDEEAEAIAAADYVAQDAAWKALRGDQLDEALEAAHSTFWNHRRQTIYRSEPVVAAMAALVTEDLIGTRGYGLEHFTTLSGPWVAVTEYWPPRLEEQNGPEAVTLPPPKLPPHRNYLLMGREPGNG